MSPTTTEPRPRPPRRHRSRDHQLRAARGPTTAARSASSTCRSCPRRASWRGADAAVVPLPADRADQQAGTVALPWRRSSRRRRRHLRARPGRAGRRPASRVGEVVARQPAVDRTAAFLPWGVEDGPRLSPVEASRASWRTCATRGISEARRRRERRRSRRRPIVLTVPASFDEEARELTLQAAQSAGLDAGHAARGADRRALRLDRGAPAAARRSSCRTARSCSCATSAAARPTSA